MEARPPCPRHRLPAFAHPPAELILEEAVSSLLSTVEIDLLLPRIGSLLRRYFGSTRVCLCRRLPDGPDWGEVLLVDDPSGQAREPRPGTRFALSGSLAGETIRRGVPVSLERLDAEAPRFPEEARLAAAGFGSLACFPLIADGAALGTLEIAHGPREGLLSQCFVHAERVARLVAIALQNGLLVAEVRRLNGLLQRENSLLREEVSRVRRRVRYVADSAPMRRVMEGVRRVAPQDATVLIRGETGTGKEGLARVIHDASPRFAGPFVAVDIGALPETLIESELFGHEKGAFTGADRRRAGKFGLASGGTLFLDEIGDAPPAIQSKLLRVLQEREVTPLGAVKPVPIDVRVIAATHRPLEEMVRAGSFRADLYYRLFTFPIELPPLRERPDDIPGLARQFLALHAARMNRQPPAIRDEQLAELRRWAWPGNVRELSNFLERALIESPGRELVLPPLPGGTAAEDAVPPWDATARAALELALARCGGKIYGADGAAALLGLRPTTLQGKLRRYGVRYRAR